MSRAQMILAGILRAAASDVGAKARTRDNVQGSSAASSDHRLARLNSIGSAWTGIEAGSLAAGAADGFRLNGPEVRFNEVRSAT